MNLYPHAPESRAQFILVMFRPTVSSLAAMTGLDEIATVFPMQGGFPAWSQITADAIEPAIRRALELAQQQVREIEQLPEDSWTFQSTFLALEQAELTLGEPWNLVSHLTNVRDEEALRDVYRKLLPEVTAFFSGIPLNESLYRVLECYARKPEAATLSSVQLRFIEETLSTFRQHGAELPADKKLRLQEIEADLSKLTQQFSENVMDSRNAWELILADEKDLAGLPQYARDAARVDAEKKGLGSPEQPRWRITQQAPSLIPFLRFAESDALRQKVWEGSTTIGKQDPWDNLPLIRQILALRQEKAALLGKPHFPDLILERRMARDGATALRFIEELAAKVRPAFLREIDELEQFRAQQTGTAVRRMHPWEIAYWSEKLRRSRYAFDEEQVRAYFPANQVLNGLFDLAQRLFGITIHKLEIDGKSANKPEVWESEVEFFQLQKGDRVLGYFYTDWYPRDNKRGGAWMDTLATGKRGAQETPHLGLICGNMTPPGSDKPALLSHEEVETIFHEFGHLLHHLLGEVPVRSLNGIHVAWDFVELPSQIMENWCWEKQSVDLFARHYQTGETIPQELWDKMYTARNFQSAMQTMRQLAFSKMDLDLHLDPERANAADIDQFLRGELRDYLIPTATPSPSILRAFGHLFSSPTGYAAGYYSYKWAEVLDSDAFERFQEEGILNPETGKAFVECVLSQGNSVAPDVLFRNFRGRDPDPTALLRRAGLA
jgi:oligopeptidase A